jgi:MFS superfamily sulfate permease-like transporter
MANWFVNIDQWDMATTLVGVVTVVMLIVLKRIKKTEKMATIITLVIMSVAVYLLSLDSVALVSSIATIPSSLPTPMLPDFSLIPKLDRCYLQHGMRIPFLTFARSLITLQSRATSQDDFHDKILGPPCP